MLNDGMKLLVRKGVCEELCKHLNAQPMISASVRSYEPKQMVIFDLNFKNTAIGGDEFTYATYFTIECVVNTQVFIMHKNGYHTDDFTVSSTGGTSDLSLFNYDAVAKRIVNIYQKEIDDRMSDAHEHNKSLVALLLEELSDDPVNKNIDIRQSGLEIVPSHSESKPYIIKWFGLISPMFNREFARKRIQGILSNVMTSLN